MTRHRGGFTLVELLVVIGIIAILIGILIPVVSRVRANAYVADSKNWISQLSGAVERYHTDFHAYPGPIPYNQIANSSTPPFMVIGGTNKNLSPATVTGYDTTSWTANKVTMAENLVLALLGGLVNDGTNFLYNPSQVGLGPSNLNPANPKRYPPYLDATNLSWHDTAAGKSGQFTDDAGTADDTIIPEFVDRFPNPMPILYLRSKLGVDPIITGLNATNNSVISNDPTMSATPPRAGAYDLSQIIGYTGSSIGVGKEVKSSEYKGTLTYPKHGLSTVDPTRSMDKSNANYQYPYDAFPYFQSPTTANVPRQKDGYILISPGRDRTYGTNDDICSFGDVNP